jgi:hypothetical protein
MKLAEIEAAFQEAILGEPSMILDSVVDSHQLSRADRFAVYSNAYRIRLREFVSNDYSVLRNALGDENFGALVDAYIAANPSHHRNARWFSRQLPEFMATSDAWRDKRLWIDLAFFERALGDAFDAADAPSLAVDVLLTVAPEDQPHMRFDLQPSLRLLKLTGGTIAAYQTAAEGDCDPLPKTGDGQEIALVWRDDELDPVYRLIDEDEALVIDAVGNGASFGEICGLLSFGGAEEDVATRAATFLASWFGAGLVTRLSCS